MPKPVWFPFYPNDFLASSKVAVMTTEEVGGYLLLLCHAWQDPGCSLPTDDPTLQRLARFAGDMTRVKACFIKTGGRFVNERLYKEWIKVKEKSALARHSVDVRWQYERNTNVIRRQDERNTNVIRTQYSSHRNIGTSEQKNIGTSEQQNIGTEEQSESPSEKDGKTCTKALPSVLKGSRTGPTWDAYRIAYGHRYDTPPVRNAKVNGQLAHVVTRLGAEAAPPVAAFYVQHNDPFYVRSRHSVNFLLRDCEGLHTQMVTGVKATTGEARNAEKQDEARAQVKRVEAMLKGGL